LNYGIILSSGGHKKEAEKVLRTTLARNPTNKDVRSILAKTYLFHNNHESLRHFVPELLEFLSSNANTGQFVSEVAKNMPDLRSNAKFAELMKKHGVQDQKNENEAEDMSFNTILPGEWENRHSPSSVLPDFSKTLSSFDFPAKFAKLLTGFDSENKSKLCRIVNNLQSLTAGVKPETIFTGEEREEINAARESARKKMVKLRENLYCHDGYFLPVPHAGVDVFVGRMGLPMLKNLQKLRNRDIIDAGGYCGDSAILLSEATDSKVYVFEPVASHVEMIKETLKNNNVRNCVVVPKALGECSKETVIRFFGSGSSINKFDNVDIKDQLIQEKIQMISLDEYVFANNLNVGFIKVDIEGYEQFFLKGAERTIRKMLPAMSISIYHNGSDFFDIKPLIESWDLGYKFKISKVPDGNIVVETALVAEVY
jgi:FkbM family methyltransferase